MIPEYMRSMYNACLKKGLFPKKWKDSKVVVLLEGPDKDKTEPRSYGPISLLSGLGKVLERMMVSRMMAKMDGKWNDRQYGFMRGKCTEDAWDQMKREVSASEFKYVCGVFVDFKGAFDFLL